MRFGLLAAGLSLALLAQAEDVAAPPAPAAPRDIVQQRLPDGRIVFTDRPQAGAATVRTWRFEPEDAAAAEARRAAAQQESQRVSERIARQIESQAERNKELDLARLRAAEAQAERDAARARAEAAAARQIVVARPLYGFVPVPVRPVPPRPGPRPPRPGSPNPQTLPGSPDDPRR
jgi:hypothetical protein